MGAELLRGKGDSFTSNEPFFFPSKTHSEAVDILLHAVSHVAVSALLIGEIGTGKSTVCRELQKKFDFISIYINDPFMTEIVLVQRTLRGLGVSVGNRSLSELIEMLKKHLVSLNTRGQTVVLLIDDAHSLSVPVLELISFLSTDHRLLRVILTGQPVLVTILENPRLSSLNQRLGIRYHLRRLDRADTVDYVFHRLADFGSSDRSPFSRGALNLIWSASGGTPRLINHLCDRALYETHSGKRREIGKWALKKVTNDPLYRPLLWVPPKCWTTRSALVGLALVCFFCLALSLSRFGFERKFLPQILSRAADSIAWLDRGQTIPFSKERRTFVRLPVSLSMHDEAAPRQVLISALGSMEPPHAVQLGDRPERLPSLLSTPGTTNPTPLKAEEWRPPEAISDNRLGAARAGPPPILTATASEPSREPFSKRRELSPKLSAIVWHEEPSKRFVVLGDHILYEGDFFEEGQLSRIHHDHVILRCGDEQVIRILRHQVEDNDHVTASDVDNEDSPPSKGGRI